MNPLLFKALGLLFLGVRVCRLVDFLMPEFRTLSFWLRSSLRATARQVELSTIVKANALWMRVLGFCTCRSSRFSENAMPSGWTRISEGSIPLALFVFIAESVYIGRSEWVAGDADEGVHVVGEVELEVAGSRGLFLPLPGGCRQTRRRLSLSTCSFALSRTSSRRCPCARLILLGRTFIVLATPHGGICFRQLGFAVLADAKPGVSARPALLGVV